MPDEFKVYRLSVRRLPAIPGAKTTMLIECPELKLSHEAPLDARIEALLDGKWQADLIGTISADNRMEILGKEVSGGQIETGAIAVSPLNPSVDGPGPFSQLRLQQDRILSLEREVKSMRSFILGIAQQYGTKTADGRYILEVDDITVATAFRAETTFCTYRRPEKSATVVEVKP